MKKSRSATLLPVPVLLFTLFFLPGVTLAAGTWTSIGPWGGDIRGIAVDAGDSNTLYAITYGCGVFKSTDGGTTWTPSGLTGGSYTLSDSSLTAMAADPVNSGVIYVGTSHGKVYKSTDGGSSWSNFYTGLPTPSTTKNITALVVDPVTPGTVYAGTAEDGIFKSTGGAWSAARGGLSDWNVLALAIDPVTSTTLYAGTDNGGGFKSVDGGATWSALLGEPNQIFSLAVDPTTASTLYIGTYGGGVYNSVDSGTTWNLANTGMGNATVEGLVVAPDASHTVYAATTWGFFKSIDAGGNWTTAETGMEASVMLNEVAIDPASSSTIYTAGRSTLLYKSTDSAANWSASSDGMGCWDFRALAIDPAVPAIYAGDYGSGVFKTTDGGATWNKVNSGLTTTVQTLVVDTVNSYIYAGTYNGIFKSTNGGASWSAINSGLSGLDTDVIAVDPFDPNHLLAFTNGGLHSSTNGGSLWVGIGGGIVDTISSISFDQNNSGNIYVSTYGGGVFKSTDGGASWTAVNTGLSTLNIDTVAVSPADSSVLYAGSYLGQAFRSIDGGANWTLSSGGMDTSYLYDMILHPGDADTAYSGTSEGIYRTTDGGVVWTTMNVGLADYRVEDLEMDPADPNVIYTVGLHSCVQMLELGGDLRLPGSVDFGDVEVNSSSTPYAITLENAGAAAVTVSDMLITGTGASQFILDVSGGSSPCGSTTPSITAGSSCTVSVTFSPTFGGSFTAALRVTSDDPQKPSIDVSLAGNGTYPLVPDIHIGTSSLLFGTVTEGTDSNPQTLYIENYGNTDLQVIDMRITGPDAAEFSLDFYSGYLPCWSAATTVSPGYYCEVGVIFSPANVGTKSATLTIVSNDPDTPAYDISLSGEGTAVPVPDIALSPLSIDFGYVINGTASLPNDVTILNGGTGDLSISNISISGADAGSFDLDVTGGSSPCGGTSLILAPAAECTVDVTFAPSMVGVKAASLDVASDDPDTSTTSVSLTGTGTPPPVPDISVSLPMMDFGTTEGEQVLTVTNAGAVSLSIGTVGSTDPLDPPFSIVSDTCSNQVIAPDGTCEITVGFYPSAASASTVRGMGLAGLGLMFVGMVFAGNIRGRRKLAALILAMTLAAGLLMSCGSSSSDDDSGNNTPPPATYTDSFDIPSDDPGTPDMTVSVLAKG